MATSLFRLTFATRTPAHYHTIAPLHTQKFQQHLVQLGSKDIHEEEYVTQCIATVKETIRSSEYGFSETGIKKAPHLLELFKEITGEASFMKDELLESTHIDFKKKFRETFEEKWSYDAAQSFYPLCGIPPNGEKIIAVQQWTHNYFCALNQLKEWSGPYPLTHLYIAQFLQRTSEHFHMHARYIKKCKFQMMTDRKEKDPISFERIMEKALKKADEDPASLSSLEREYVNFKEICINSTMCYFPDIDKKADLLRSCVWKGFNLQKLKVPITEPNSHFADLFKE